MCIASPIRRAGGSAGGAALSSGEGTAGSGSIAVCTGGATGSGGALGTGRAGVVTNTGGGATRGAAKADAVGERNATASSAGAAGA